MINLNLKTSVLALSGLAVGLSVPSSTRAVSLTQKETSVVLGGAKQLVVGATQNSTTDSINIIDQDSVIKKDKQLKRAEAIKRLDQDGSAAVHNAVDKPKKPAPQVVEETPSTQVPPVAETPKPQTPVAPTEPAPAPTTPSDPKPVAPEPDPLPEPEEIKPTPKPEPDASNIQDYVLKGLISRGWSQADANTMVNSIIGRESGWNPSIYNPSSGAYGLFQLMPQYGAAGSGVDTQMDVATSLYFNGGLQHWIETWY